VFNAAQAARDLLWAVNSASFVSGDEVAPNRPLSENDIDAAHLSRFIEDLPGHRVGRYFERLLHFWLEHIRGVEIVAVGMQLRDGNVTVGELDFLYRDEAGRLVHCEASVKFFLHLEGHKPSAFPGPNATDNYERKISKLFDHQLPRSHGHVDGIDLRHAFVKGIVFYRPGETNIALPDRLPPDKPHWLRPLLSERCRSLAEQQEFIAQHFMDPAPPLMLSLRSAADPQTELRRVFVVDDVWPERP